MPAAAAALRMLRNVRQKLQGEQEKQEKQPPLVSTESASQLATSKPLPRLLRASELERSRALSNAQTVMPSSLLHNQEQTTDSSLFSSSRASDYMRRTGLRDRLAAAERSQDNSGFFESPASLEAD